MVVDPKVTMDDPNVKTVHCTGSPFEIGFTHGSSVSAEIHHNIGMYTYFFEETAKLTWEQARERAATQFLPTIKKQWPEIVEEMRGIANGAEGGLTLDDIVTLKTWTRRKRAFIGLAVVGIPLMAAWIWEIVRVRNYDRSSPRTHPMDWTEGRFAAIFILFVLNWVSSILMQYIILYFLSCMTNSPAKAANYAGVYRGFLASGEAICFGLDSIAVPYIKEAGVLFAFYATGVLVFIYIAAFHITDTEYFTGEEGVVIPVHVVVEHEYELDKKQTSLPDAEQSVALEVTKHA